MSNPFLLIAGMLGALAVMIGAFGAHGLEQTLTPAMLQRYHTGVEYHFYHTLALFGTGLWLQFNPNRWLKPAGWSFISGIVLFSGSLYLYSISSLKAFVIITPFGGLAFIIAWLLLCVAAWQQRKP